jgi:hypothetical protein
LIAFFWLGCRQTDDWMLLADFIFLQHLQKHKRSVTGLYDNHDLPSMHENHRHHFDPRQYCDSTTGKKQRPGKLLQQVTFCPTASIESWEIH